MTPFAQRAALVRAGYSNAFITGWLGVARNGMDAFHGAQRAAFALLHQQKPELDKTRVEAEPTQPSAA